VQTAASRALTGGGDGVSLALTAASDARHRCLPASPAAVSLLSFRLHPRTQ